MKVRAARPAAKPFDAEGLLAFQIRADKLPEPLRQHRFASSIGRKWQFDFSFPPYMLAVEIDGGAFIGGHHSRGVGVEDDCEKVSNAVMLGWSVMRVTPRQVKNGKAVAWLLCALTARGWQGPDG